MYFMQEAGEPLKLKYAKASFGPYAENLRHVLNQVEGHLVSGYADGGDAPAKLLELVPGAIEDAQKLIAESADTHERFDRVADLVSGFETPFGLELLATVHWVANDENPRSVNETVERTNAWGDRKKRFSKRHIELALRLLAERSGFSPSRMTPDDPQCGERP